MERTVAVSLWQNRIATVGYSQRLKKNQTQEIDWFWVHFWSSRREFCVPRYKFRIWLDQRKCMCQKFQLQNWWKHSRLKEWADGQWRRSRNELKTSGNDVWCLTDRAWQHIFLREALEKENWDVCASGFSSSIKFVCSPPQHHAAFAGTPSYFRMPRGLGFRKLFLTVCSVLLTTRRHWNLSFYLSKIVWVLEVWRRRKVGKSLYVLFRRLNEEQNW